MQNNGFNSIILDHTVTSLSDNTFYQCRILSDQSNNIQITFTDAQMSIGDYAFLNCLGLTQINVPPHFVLTSLGYMAFDSCVKLTGFGTNATTMTISSFHTPITMTAPVSFYGCESLTVAGINFASITGCTKVLNGSAGVY
jgi:hypothetical protein